MLSGPRYEGEHGPASRCLAAAIVRNFRADLLALSTIVISGHWLTETAENLGRTPSYRLERSMNAAVKLR